MFHIIYLYGLFHVIHDPIFPDTGAAVQGQFCIVIHSTAARGYNFYVIRMISKESVAVDTTSFQNDMANLKSAYDVITLLIHLGYLTYDYRTGRARIPNDEVALEYMKSIKDGGWENVMNAIRASDELMRAILAKEENKVAQILEQVHADNTSILKYNDENSLACVLSLACYSAKKDYVMYRELPAGVGYADVVFVPGTGIFRPAIVVELKYDKSIKAAIDQIHDRKYMDCLKDYSGKILLIGINYDKKVQKRSIPVLLKNGSDDYIRKIKN